MSISLLLSLSSEDKQKPGIGGKAARVKKLWISKGY
jgi:hypothetical protein